MVTHDLAKDPPSRDLLEKLIPAEDAASYLNARSPAYKERDLGTKSLTKRQVIDLMLEEPNLIRRPLVLRGTKAVFGFSPEQYEELI